MNVVELSVRSFLHGRVRDVLSKQLIWEMLRSGPYVIAFDRPLDKREELFLSVCELRYWFNPIS